MCKSIENELISCLPKMEPKLANILAHQLHLQSTQQQWPFPESPFGRLPGEIRQMIYESVLVAPPSQPTKYLRVPVTTATFTGMASAEGNSITMASETGSTVRSLLTPTNPKNSYVAILQTCRQIYHEAFHIFYARNSFHFPNAPDLIAFVRGIGPLRRAELTSLHIEGLVIDRLPSRDFVHRRCLRRNISLADEERLAAISRPAPHPDIYNKQNLELLHGCKKLSRLILDMRAEEGFGHVVALRWCLGLERPEIYLVDESHWKVVCRTVDLPSGRMLAAVSVFRNYRNGFSCWAKGNKVRVEVDIIRNSEEMSIEGVPVLGCSSLDWWKEI